MAENQEVLRQALLSDLAAPRKPRQDLDHCADAANWKSQANLELIHQSSSQLVLNMKKTLMEMI